MGSVPQTIVSSSSRRAPLEAAFGLDHGGPLWLVFVFLTLRQGSHATEALAAHRGRSSIELVSYVFADGGGRGLRAELLP